MQILYHLSILGIIPARYESSRFPGKPLAMIAGKTMIQRVYEQCKKAKSLTSVVVATDDKRIYDAVTAFGGNAIMTSTAHLNGTSRCAEVQKNEDDTYDFIINIQGDEPLINPEQIDELSRLFEDANAEIVTQVKEETDLSQLENKNIVKAILDENHFAIDFVRIGQASTDNGRPIFYKHIGIYGFRVDVLKQLVRLAPTANELEHHLEQLRWLDNGFKLKAGITEFESISVDTPEDLETVRKTLNL